MQFILFSLRFVFQQKFPFFLLFVFLLVIFLDFLKMAKRRWDGVFGGVVEGSRNNFRLFTFVFPYFLLFFLSLRSSASIIFIFVYFVAKFPELFLLLSLLLLIFLLTWLFISAAIFVRLMAPTFGPFLWCNLFYFLFGSFSSRNFLFSCSSFFFLLFLFICLFYSLFMQIAIKIAFILHFYWGEAFKGGWQYTNV